MRKVLISCVALFLALSCSKISSPTEPVLGTGKLVTTVYEATSHAGIANVTVEIRQVETGPVVVTATTNTSGVSEIAVPAGAYWIRVVPPVGYSFAGGRADLLGTQLTIGAGGTAGITIPLSKM
ncbi:MAG TPA: carboxypeptidase-like regulatory domain-containing protein [Thermoanaerobaculia bacterium]|nr:carboxypeptidase-like regulatory domain-containing protein [Thermoanaerobaculia bacterium]